MEANTFLQIPFPTEYESNDSTSDNSSDSPPPPPPSNLSSSSSPKKSSRRAIQKRVISVPIKQVEESRLKNDHLSSSSTSGSSNAPPSDSWAWRKYGQKPIKGSPYPRAYYRCSSSKGCPARKQVERSRADPTMLVITYCCEHNHPGPVSRSHHNHNHSAAARLNKPGTSQLKSSTEPEAEPGEKFRDLSEESLITGDEFGWFRDMETTSSTVLESPIFAERCALVDATDDVAKFFPMREEDESLFADLGELPECSLVFPRGGPLQRDEEQRRRFNSPWCGTIG